MILNQTIQTKVRILTSILIFLCACTFDISANDHLRSSEEILTECRKMFYEVDELNTIEKRVQWIDAQNQTEALRKLILTGDSIQLEDGAWQDYYLQLIRLFYLLDPSRPMSEYRPYMNDLCTLVRYLPPAYHPLKWYAYRKVSQLYILDGKEAKAFKVLEKVVQDVLSQSTLTHRDSANLAMAMLGQLYCKGIPQKLGWRNLSFLKDYPKDIRMTIGEAIFRENHHRVITLADSLLQTDNIRFLERFYLSKRMYESLQRVPASRYNARRMMRLLALQDSLYADIQRARNTDYSTYKELQVQQRIQAEVVKNSRAELARFYHTGTILGIVVLVLILLFWYNNRQTSKFKLSLLQSLRKEKQAQSTAFLEAKAAYAKQANLVRNLNHDLRVPLNALIGFSDILTSSEELTEEERQDAGQNIQQSSDQLLTMINNLLAIARVETNKMSLRYRNLQASDLFYPTDWEELTAKLAPNHTLRILPIDSDRLLHTDDRHIRHIIELVVKHIAKHTESNNILVDSSIDSGDKLRIEIQSAKKQQSIATIQHAFDSSKTMSDYEDANSYCLVLARMLAQLIGARLELGDQASDTLYIHLIVPLDQ